MKKNKLLIMTLAAAILLLAAGCKAAPAPGVTPAPDPAAPVTDPGEPVADTEPAEISADFLAQDVLDQYDSINLFSEFGDENTQKIIFTSTGTIKNFKYIAVNFREENENIILEAGEELYSVDELSPDLPFAVTWEDIGLIPNRGVSYVDEAGKVRNFCITISGKDGSLLITEF